jgi:cysteinyl-tRNA synthetase
MDTEDDAANNEQSWQNNIYNKYLLFQTSAVQMELANPVAAPLHHHHSPDVSMKTRLTSCADMLASSYLTVKEFKEQCQQSEDAIVNATTEIDAVLESLFPARGKKMTSIPTTGQQRRSTESTKSIDELLSTRKEAIAAKLALLMIPKR